MSTLEVVDSHNKPILLSHSQKTSWLRCANAFRLEKGGYPRKPAVFLIGGTAFHASADDVDYHLLNTGAWPTPDEARAFWVKNFDEGCREAAKVEPDTSLWKTGGRRTKDKPNKEDLAWWREAGGEMVLQYVTWRIIEVGQGLDIWQLPDGTPAIEVPFEFELGEKIIVRGMIDRIMWQAETGLLTRDLKTSQREPDDKSQLGIYRLAIHETFGELSDWGDYFLARTGAASNPTPLHHFSKELLMQEFGFFALAKRLGIYPANPGQACITCNVKAACAAVGGPEAHEWRFAMPK